VAELACTCSGSETGCAHAEWCPQVAPVCKVCNDTHVMQLAGRDVPCTHCPTPCAKCRAGGNGPYCEKTPCACACHAPPVSLERAVRVQLGDVKNVHLQLDPAGHRCKLLFDGIEQENVYSVAIHAEVGARTSVRVGFYPTEVTIEGPPGKVVRLDRSSDLEQLVESAYDLGFEAGKKATGK
jgi:hypothetical protein